MSVIMAAGLLLAPAAAVPADRIEVLRPAAGDETRLCGADGSWCARIAAGEGVPTVLELSSGRIELAPVAPRGDADRANLALWPRRIVLGDGTSLVGVIDQQSTAYSGGGAWASQLTLYRVPADGAVRAVLTVPWEGGAMIRACFSEADYRQRAGACHDEYSFSASLSLVPGNGAGPAVLRYRTRATSYPGAVSRSADSLAGKRLRQRDLKRVVDPDCSVTRLLRIDPASGSYVPDGPLPDCADYTVP